MLSKCANPECSEILHDLRHGKIFRMFPTPEVQLAAGPLNPALYERFWLCGQCAKGMTILWGGTGIMLVPLPAPKKPVENTFSSPVLDFPKPNHHGRLRRRPRGRAASAGREDR